MTDRVSQVRKNVEAVHSRIAHAAHRTNRDPDEIRLIAVSKYVDAEATRDLVAAGCRILGESRPQALWDKADALSDLDVRWHQIGHLQRNKLRRTLPLVSMVHSVDSIRLLNAIDEVQAGLHPNRPMPILLEVNTSGDSAKHGFAADQAAEAVESAASKAHLDLRGLMCMAGLGTTPEEARRDFAALRLLRDELESRYPDQSLHELSMGMSSDFETAIEEGATMVRVGSLLFRGSD